MAAPSLLAVPGRSAVRLSTYSTDGGLSPGKRERSSAAAPATYGLANDVPDAVIRPPSLMRYGAVFSTPGAHRLTHTPKLLNDASASPASVAPTVTIPLGTPKKL